MSSEDWVISAPDWQAIGMMLCSRAVCGRGFNKEMAPGACYSRVGGVEPFIKTRRAGDSWTYCSSFTHKDF